MIRSCAALASAVIALSAAQASAHFASGVMQSASPVTLSLRSGTPVQLRMSQALTAEGKKLCDGERFQMKAAEAVTLNGQTIIPVGSPATSEVTDVRNKGMWGAGHGFAELVLAAGRQPTGPQPAGTAGLLLFLLSISKSSTRIPADERKAEHRAA
jgi:hypothetical protein